MSFNDLKTAYQLQGQFPDSVKEVDVPKIKALHDKFLSLKTKGTLAQCGIKDVNTAKAYCDFLMDDLYKEVSTLSSLERDLNAADAFHDGFMDGPTFKSKTNAAIWTLIACGDVINRAFRTVEAIRSITR